MRHWFVLFLFAAPALLHGQAPEQRPLAFDVASVKAVKREAPLQKSLACIFPSRERFSGFGWLRIFIACAYEIPLARAREEIVGGPTWINDDVFEIEAKTPPGHTLASLSEGLAMLQLLLADRFTLVVHRETREVQSYALVVARRDGTLGPQLRPTRQECGDWIAGGRHGAPPTISGDLPCGREMVSGFAFRSNAMPLSQFVNLLATRVERPVEDRTGLTGTFAMDLRWRAEQGGPDATSSGDLPTSIFTALQEQLGLKLVPTKATANVLVIDHVEKPTPD